MVGANYMGGKRSTARAKSKDIVGRAQRRHFGKQRLAFALCATQEKHAGAGLRTPSSGLPEIALAHARRHAISDSGATCSRPVFSGDRLYSPTSSNGTRRRSKASKVLGALDILDHASMRTAIKRILQQPNLVGINTTDHRDTARMRSPPLSRRPIDARLVSSENPDAQRPETKSTRAFDSCAGNSQFGRHQPAENNTRFGPTKRGQLSPLDSPSTTWDTTSLNPFDDIGYEEARSFTGVNFQETRDGWPDTTLDVAHGLPRSSPFPSSSQSSDSSIIDIDTSPRAFIHLGRLNELSEDVSCLGASPSRSFHQPMFCQPSRSCPIPEASVDSEETHSTSSSLVNWIENETEAEQSQTCYSDRRTFPDSRASSLARSASNFNRNMTNREVAEEPRILIDFLSDPHPWETIGKIMNLKPPRVYTEQSAAIGFTVDKERVGYESPEKLGAYDACFPDAASVETRIDDMDDTHGASDADPRTLASEVSIVDSCMVIDALDSPCTRNSTWPLRDMGLPFVPQAEAHPDIHVHTLQDAPMVHCIQQEDTRPSAPEVGTTASELDIDVTFDGPCLFGDSDLEEDD